MSRFYDASELLRSLASEPIVSVPFSYSQPAVPVTRDHVEFPTLSLHLDDVTISEHLGDVVGAAIRVARNRKVNVLLEIERCRCGTTYAPSRFNSDRSLLPGNLNLTGFDFLQPLCLADWASGPSDTLPYAARIGGAR